MRRRLAGVVGILRLLRGSGSKSDGYGDESGMRHERTRTIEDLAQAVVQLFAIQRS